MERLPQIARHPEDGSGSGEHERLPDKTPISRVEMTVRASQYMEENEVKTLEDMRKKITRAKLAMDGLTNRSRLYREIVDIFETTGSHLRDANSDNLDWGKR